MVNIKGGSGTYVYLTGKIFMVRGGLDWGLWIQLKWGLGTEYVAAGQGRGEDYILFILWQLQH